MNKQLPPNRQHLYSPQRGGAAIEYIVVSIFALTLSITAIGVLTAAYKDRLQVFSEKSGVEIELDEFDFGFD
jgi:hypothetical protein